MGVSARDFWGVEKEKSWSREGEGRGILRWACNGGALEKGPKGDWKTGLAAKRSGAVEVHPTKISKKERSSN